MNQNLQELKEIILENSINIKQPKITGVYFLIMNTDIIYIGKSCDILKRIKEHLKAGIIKFESWYCLSYEDEFIALTKEKEYINMFSPVHNKIYSRNYIHNTSNKTDDIRIIKVDPIKLKRT